MSDGMLDEADAEWLSPRQFLADLVGLLRQVSPTPANAAADYSRASVKGRALDASPRIHVQPGTRDQVVRGLTEYVAEPGMLGTDFADLELAFSQTGRALATVGTVARSCSPVLDAARSALAASLLDGGIRGAHVVVVCVSECKGSKLREIQDAVLLVEAAAGGPEELFAGAVAHSTDCACGACNVVLLATGLPPRAGA